MLKGKANIVMDGQWGSTGKGKLVGYLALNHEINVAMCDFMTNAGHTFVSDDGESLITCQLPMAFVNTDCVLMINPGAAITLERLEKEIEMFADYKIAERLLIHPHTAIIEEIDRQHESAVLNRISSTLKGCGGSRARKIMRIAKLAKDEPKLKPYISDTTMMLQAVLKGGGTALLEGAQGFDLSLNHGTSYPYVTSRDVTTMSILNAAGIPPFYLGDVYGSIRTYPIRVGNVYDKGGKQVGWSGPNYPDQKETNFAEIAKLSGYEKDLTERTTVTNKIRRIFTFSNQQFNRFINVCAPSKIFINFINHLCSKDEGVRTESELSSISKSFVDRINTVCTTSTTGINSVPKPKISHIGTGAKNSDMVIL